MTLAFAFILGALLSPHIVRAWRWAAYRWLWFSRHWPRRCVVCGRRGATNTDFDIGNYHVECESALDARLDLKRKDLP